MAPKKKKVMSVEEMVWEVDVPLGNENVKMENIADETVEDNFPSSKPVKGKQNEKDNPADEEAGHTKESGFTTRREEHKIPSKSLLRARAAEHEGRTGPLEITNHANKASDEGTTRPTEISKQPDKKPSSPMMLAGIFLVVAFLLVIMAILIAPEKGCV